MAKNQCVDEAIARATKAVELPDNLPWNQSVISFWLGYSTMRENACDSEDVSEQISALVRHN
jgi:hypothetical protein